MGRRDRQNKVWLRSHASGEGRFAKTLERYFNDQAGRIAEAIERAGDVPPNLAGIVGHPADENAKLIRTIHPGIVRLTGLGAWLELEAAPAPPRKDIQVELPFDEYVEPFHLPRNVLASIRRALAVVERQPYWIAIQHETTRLLTDCILEGIAAGGGLRDIVRRVHDELGGGASKVRAKRIARTETTACLNCGHYEARQTLIDDGLVTGSEWLGLSDGRQRKTHTALDGVVIKAGEMFSVGGHLAPYPGHYSLPGSERINCRCTTVAASTWADD